MISIVKCLLFLIYHDSIIMISCTTGSLIEYGGRLLAVLHYDAVTQEPKQDTLQARNELCRTLDSQT